MLVSRVLSRIPRTISAHCRTSLFLPHSQQPHSFILSIHFHSLLDSPNKSLLSQLPHSLNASTTQRSCGISSSSAALPPPTKNQSEKECDSTANNNGASKNSDPAEELGSNSESEAEFLEGKKTSDWKRDLSADDQLRLIVRKEEVYKMMKQQQVLKMKVKEIVEKQDKLVRDLSFITQIVAIQAYGTLICLSIRFFGKS